MSIKSVPIKIGDSTFQLRYDPSSLYAFRKETGASLIDVLQDEGAMLDYLAPMVWAGLHWRMKSLKVSAVSDMIVQYAESDGLESLVMTIAEAIEGAGWISSDHEGDGTPL